MGSNIIATLNYCEDVKNGKGNTLFLRNLLSHFFHEKFLLDEISLGSYRTSSVI